MNKRIKRQFWLSPEENAELKRKAKLSGINETSVIRILIRGYEPKEKPDGRFYEAMRQLSAIGNSINQLALKANALGFIDTPMLKAEALRWHRFQADIEAMFLRPGTKQFEMAIKEVKQNDKTKIRFYLADHFAGRVILLAG